MKQSADIKLNISSVEEKFPTGNRIRKFALQFFQACQKKTIKKQNSVPKYFTAPLSITVR